MISQSCNFFVVAQAWIGLQDFVQEGIFQWITNQQAPEYTNWHLGNPNDAANGEDCGEITVDGLWNDNDCEFHLGSFVCERR